MGGRLVLTQKAPKIVIFYHSLLYLMYRICMECSKIVKFKSVNEKLCNYEARLESVAYWFDVD